MKKQLYVTSMKFAAFTTIVQNVYVHQDLLQIRRRVASFTVIFAITMVIVQLKQLVLEANVSIHVMLQNHVESIQFVRYSIHYQ